MRVVHVAPTAFGPGGLFGGGERYPVELARALSKYVDCTLVTFGASARSYSDPSGLEVVVLKTKRLLRGHPAHPVATDLHRHLAADVVHTHHMRSVPSRVAAIASKLQRRKTAVTDHGLGPGGFAGLLPRLFDRFLTVSAYSARVLNAPASKTRVVFGGTDPERFSPDRGGDRDGIIYVGRITPHKGIDQLIRALPDGVGLRIVGSQGHDRRPPESGYRAFLEELAVGKNVDFYGPASEEELPKLIASACGLVLPSVHHTCYGRYVAIPELLGLAMIEAMACETPVICSRIGGLPEVVQDGTTGFVVDAGDVGALRERIAALTGDATLRQTMGRAAREDVLARFTWDHCARRCVAAYEELVA
ncbi:MAG: glycosyltransferase family 4 protein [Actinomycetota bacterium]|nr:glycosyltransferase family 4 protein [Actinomycetota bacterium]